MIQVSVSADRAYLPHVATMLHSAVTVDEQPPLDVHLVHGDDVTASDLGPLASMLARHGGHLRDHLVDANRLAGLSTRRFSITAWYRVLLPELLPGTERIIHLDGDALVRTPLCGLWDTDLRGAAFAAVENPLYPWMAPAWERLGLAPGTRYLNSGVLVLDLDALRGLDAVDRLLAYGSDHPANPWPEQDALAAVLAHEWTPLHPRWNLQTIVSELPVAALPWAAEETQAARREPAVVHFSGPLKPWDGWGARRLVCEYLAHRALSGYPLDQAPRRPTVAPLLPHLPLQLRRKFVNRVLRDRRTT